MERLLGHNDLFKATRNVAELAQRIQTLQRFVHVSTAYVSSFMPKGSWVDETVRPLGAFYIKDVGLPNVYTFTKNLAEQLMLDLHAVDFPVSIVRPTIVSCLNGAPAPGYFGNNSGAIAFVMAFATGMAHHTCHDQDHHVQDVIPCDLVASVIIAAGAIRHQIKPGSTPSVFHVASSTTHSEPVANHFRRIFLPYWTQRPPPFTLYSRPYRKLWKKGFYSPEESLTFRYRNFCQAMHIGVLALGLNVSGKKHIARLLKKQWKTWKLYNTEAMDFNLFFSVSNTAALYDSLPKSTASDFKMLWQAPEDSWDDYYRLVFDAIHTKIFKTQSA
ncbi:hypothetical protein CVIRNUC_004631 [Coccomyxa viridis]|uniref:Fatty acyl-CoA reductase n=1 Tax=Coccomyxa viridis TaxID=1274662 RepID=A0AAV1I241_9CHLO|nr:hypothetical protein CVIRNUC_004631 [Coccomyxa viridis]